MAENWRGLAAALERLAKQNPGIQTIADGLERNARRILRAEHVKTTKPNFFLDDPPGGASPLVRGCYQILRDIHSLRQAIARSNATAAAYHAFYIGRQRQVIIATRDRVWDKICIADKQERGAAAKRLPPTKREELAKEYAALLKLGMSRTAASRKLSKTFDRTPRAIRRILAPPEPTP